MTGAGAARFEFRVWGDQLGEATGLLRSLSEPLEIRESSETYFVSTATVDANPKARADLLDVKVLVGIRDGFQQWDVHTKVQFPVDAAVVAGDLFPLLGLAAPRLERDDYSLAQLIAEVAAPHPDLAAVEVTKMREMHMVNSCSAEVTQASIAGHEVETVAVESTDLDELREARRILGLDGRANISYPQAIRSALGGRF